MKKRLFITLLLFCALITSISAPLFAAQETQVSGENGFTQAAPTWPQPIPGGIHPTITLNRQSGTVDQAITVSGQGLGGYPAVRIAWLFADSTLMVAEVPLNNDGGFQTMITVPAEAPTGATKICATVEGSTDADFACAPFTVLDPPPGEIKGQIPLKYLPQSQKFGAAIRGVNDFNTQLLLLDRSGQTVAGTAVDVNGRFNLGNIPPGTYQTAITGDLIRPIVTDYAPVAPGEILDWLGDQWIKEIPCTNLARWGAAVSAMSASPSFGQDRAATPYGLVRDFLGGEYDPAFDFGTYIAGVDLPVTFTAHVQAAPGQTVTGMNFELRRPGKIIPLGSGSPAGGDAWQITFNMQNIPYNEGARYWLYATPQLASGFGSCRGERKVDIMSDPMRDPRFQPGGQTWWANGRYQFAGTIPRLIIAGHDLLPAEYTSPKFPVTGRLHNSLSAGIEIKGSLGLDGDLHLTMARAQSELELINQTILDKDWAGFNLPVPAKAYSSDDLRNLPIDLGDYTIWKFKPQAPVAGGPIATFFGIVSIAASVSVGGGGELTIDATLYPFQPGLEASLTPNLEQTSTLTLMLDVLLGVLDAGGDFYVALNQDLPLTLAIGPDPWVELNACLDIQITLRAWVSYLWGLGKESTSHDLVKDGGCLQIIKSALGQDELPPPPRVFASPDVAVAKDGRRLAAYIADQTPDAETPNPRLVARFWNSATGEWGPEMALSNPAHTPHSPTVTFFGPDLTPVIVWAETVLTKAEAQGMGEDLLGRLKHQEIFYATWDGSAWSTPVRLTDDDVADGLPTAAGDEEGLSIAWVRDTPGTKGDGRRAIALRTWDALAGGWLPQQIIAASTEAAVIPYSTQVPAVDGQCDPANEYNRAMRMQYEETGGQKGTIYALHDMDYLYVCTSGPLGTNDARWTAVQLDTDNGRESLAQAEDLTLGIGLDEGNLATGKGTGSGGYDPTTVSGWTAARSTNNGDTAEFRIPLSVTGGGCDQPFGLSLFHYWVNSTGDDWGWPTKNGWDSPQTWGTVQLECAVKGMNAQPDVARVFIDSGCLAAPCSRTVLAWTADGDRDLATNGDRRIVFATPQNHLGIAGSFNHFEHPALPAGSDSPAINLRLEEGKPIAEVAFLVRDKDGDGITDTGIGNRAQVWSGSFTLAGESFAPDAFAPVKDGDQPVYGEQPDVVSSAGGPQTILYRRFGPAGTTGYLGQIAISQEGKDGKFDHPLYLTDESRQNWQGTGVIDPQSRELVSLKVGRSAFADVSNLEPVTDGPSPAVQTEQLNGDGDPVSAILLPVAADPALASLTANEPGGAIGAAVELAVTVRNVGLAPAEGLQVTLYQGDPASKQILAQTMLPEALDSGAQATVKSLVTPDTADFQVTAVVSSSIENASTENDQASLLLAALLPPPAAGVGESSSYKHAADVNWLPSPSARAGGYRILRSTDSGPYSFVGEAKGTTYTDAKLGFNHTYCYQVEAYDSSGARSQTTEQACLDTTLPDTFFPVISRP